MSIATLQVLLIDPTKPDLGPVYAMGLLVGCAFLASLSSLTIKEDLRRIDYTERQTLLMKEEYNSIQAGIEKSN